VLYLFAQNPDALVMKYPRLYAAVLVRYEIVHGEEFHEKTYEDM
jgi:hypothetical protein